MKRTWAEMVACTVLACLLPANLSAQQLRAQQAVPDAPRAVPGNSSTPEVLPAGPGAAVRLTLEDAIARARKLSPTLQAAWTNAAIAAEAVSQARAANLPTISANSQYLYTEGNGTSSARYIANNGVHEYIAQGDAHQTLSAALWIDHRRAALLAAVARDQAEIAQRGLVVTVVQNYADVVAADGKLQAAEQELDAAQTFLRVTQQLEQGGEVAHADVIKAQIQLDDSKVALSSAQLAQEQAHLVLALLTFVDIHQAFRVSEDPAQMLALPAFADAEARARHANPDLDAARNAQRAAKTEIASARAGYLPTLTFDAFYGIDANQFAVRTLTDTGPIDNLGYSGLLSLNVPIFNWGATHSQVKQAEYREQQAATELSYAQRALRAELEQFYRAAQEAKGEMEVRKQAAADAHQSRDLTLLQYKAGMDTALEVVNAESTLSLEQSAYYDAESRYAVALANLATLTGSLHP